MNKYNTENTRYNIAVVGTGYVGLSLAVLLAQNNQVTAIDVIPEKVNLINEHKSPIQDEYIENYLAEKDLDLTATVVPESAYKNADYVIIATPTNYDPEQNFFDCSEVENVIMSVVSMTKGRKQKPTIVIKSTIPVGFTESLKNKYDIDNIIFSPEFLRE